MDQYNVIGIMSGSSLDGVDICFTRFTKESKWSFEILETHTLVIPKDIKQSLIKSDQLNGYELNLLNIQYGEWVGQNIKARFSKETLIDVVGFHGHTTFHDPNAKLSLQLGSGAIISAITNIPVVDDFRTKDILLGGQGAPLVPKGELLLFPGYDAWVNLGGIANITLKKENQIMAWDIAPCNQVLNYFAQKLGADYDENGKMAQYGEIDDSWIATLQKLTYFNDSPPKSLSNQWVTENILKTATIPPANGLKSYAEFLSGELKNTFQKHLHEKGKVLFTGGGTHNKYLMELIQKNNPNQFNLIIPSKEIIDFKEALIFGFLALLRKIGIPNTIGIATGAMRDTVSGTLHEP